MDDWGADFVGGIVLTPKTSGPRSLWDHGRTALQEESEGSDGSCDAKFDDSVSLGLYVCNPFVSRYCTSKYIRVSDSTGDHNNQDLRT